MFGLLFYQRQIATLKLVVLRRNYKIVLQLIAGSFLELHKRIENHSVRCHQYQSMRPIVSNVSHSNQTLNKLDLLLITMSSLLVQSLFNLLGYIYTLIKILP